eukprot:TRINITY_DN8965_c0_g1_i1.p4 TRINITY_DN8965_c0_g1~~TRINITY_DN8965_c0_g1_i1.p4  ORF type:complete len:71 (+),score=11.56 TRINITY_DN8965_c0_g1_i1:302-514(+)
MMHSVKATQAEKEEPGATASPNKNPRLTLGAPRGDSKNPAAEEVKKQGTGDGTAKETGATPAPKEFRFRE